MSTSSTPSRQRTSANTRFTQLFATPLGSPFLTTTELPTTETREASETPVSVQQRQLESFATANSICRATSEPPTAGPSSYNTYHASRHPFQRNNYTSSPPRSSSPSPSTAGYSIIGAEEANESPKFFPQSSPYKGFGSLGRKAANLSSPSLNYFSSANHSFSNGNSPSTIKSFLPRLWDALVSTPTKSIIPAHRHSVSPLTHRHTMYSFGTSSMVQRKGKEKATYKNDIFSNGKYGGHVDYVSISPLDDDDGELIDDEACFVAVDFWGVGIESSRARVVTGIDILSLLPIELSLYILSLLGPSCDPMIRPSQVENETDPLRALLVCMEVSRRWNKLASDNEVWRALFLWRWGPINESRVEPYFLRQVRHAKRRQTPRRTVSLGGDELFRGPSAEKDLPPLPTQPRTSSLRLPTTLDWRRLFRERFELERRWHGKTTCRPKIARMASEPSSLALNAQGSAAGIDMKDYTQEQWEPTLTRLTGHSDSVYCLEFTDQYIITGSRDRTIKVWSQRTSRCLTTFGADVGDTGHHGSVLCLRLFWDELQPASETISSTTSRAKPRSGRVLKKGLLFSGSSDCTICVWDLTIASKATKRRPSAWGPGRDWKTSQTDFDSELVEDDNEVVAEIKTILRGHEGGVLDLRVDASWVVSCSKDAVIRVWDRKTLQLYRTLKGHEGPVNAVGLEDGKIVSASGDGKMILWDIQTGRKLRTFEGHDRGLACIGFKDGLIVSGSNDCRIKIWSAITGECLVTLVGHRALVRTLAFDPRSGRLVSGSYDKSIRVWDLWTGKLIREFKNHHTSHIFDVKFDASRIVSTSHDQKISILDFSRGIDSADLFT